MIQLEDERFWLYAAVDPGTNNILHIRLYPRRRTVLTEMILSEFHETNAVRDYEFLVDGAPWQETALSRPGPRFRQETHGYHNAVEYVYRGGTTNIFVFKYD